MKKQINQSTFGRALLRLDYLALAVTLLATPLHAASHTWSGAVSGNWSDAGNWSSGGVPTVGETNSITLSASATRTVITNNIGALKVSSFSMPGSNYIVRGASTFSIQSSLINFLCSGGSNTIESPITFASLGSLAINGSSTLVLSGMVGGSDGFVKNGTGNLYLRGTASNPLSGDVSVNSGELHLAKTGGASPYNGNSIAIGSTDVTDPTQLFLEADNQISDAVNLSIQPSGALVMNSHTDIVGTATMYSGVVDTGTGILGINSELNLSPRHVGGLTYESPTIIGKLEFNGAACTINVSSNTCNIDADIVENGGVTILNKTGPGTLWLKGGGNNPGAINVLAGTLRAGTANALGTVAGSTTVATNATLIFSAGVTTSESLVLSNNAALEISGGAVSSSGNVSLPGGTVTVYVPSGGAALTLNGLISGAGGLKKTGDGSLLFGGAGNNTFAGATFVNGGTLTLDKFNDTRAIGSVTVTNGAALVLASNEQIDNGGTVSVYTGGFLNMANHNESVGGLNLGGGATLDTGTGTLTLLGKLFAGPPYSPYSQSNTPATLRGNLSLGGALRTIQTTNTELVFDCLISDGAGVGGLRQEWGSDGFGPYGGITLLRSNSFTGPVYIDTFCWVSNAFAFGAPSGGVWVTNTSYGSSLIFQHPSMAVSGETLTLQNYLSLNAFGTNAWNGPVVLQTNGVATGYFEHTGGSTGDLTVSGQISGVGGVESYSGRLRLTASNSYSGVTFVTGYGNLIIQHPNGLGTTNRGTTVIEGGNLRLELPSGAAISGEPLTFTGATPTTNDWLTVAGAVSNNWSGPITTDGQPARVNVLASAGVLTLNSTIGGTGGLEKTGDGKLILAGTNPNTYPGETKVVTGSLVLNKPNGVQATANVTVNPGARLEWGASEQIADAATLSLIGYSFSSATNAYLANHNETITHLTLLNGRLDNGSGALTLLGNVDVSNPDFFFDSYNSIFGTMRLGPGTHQIFNSHYGTGTKGSILFLWDSIEETGGSGGLTFKGCGIRLHGSNSFTGPVIADAAFLNIHHPHALGGISQGTLLTNSAGLDLAMSSGSVSAAEPLVLSPPAPGALFPSILSMYGEYTNTWSGPITLLGSNQVVITLGSKLTVTGPVHGPAALYAYSGGELVLAGSQPNSCGDLIVDIGIMRLAKPAGVPAFLGNLTLDGQFISSTLILEAPNQFLPQTTVTVGVNGANALLELNGHAATISTLTGYGAVNIGTGTLTISNSSGNYGFNGNTLGSAGGTRLIKQGSASQGLYGNNTLNGDVFVQGGTLGLGDSTIGAMNLADGTTADLFAQTTHWGSLAGGGNIDSSASPIRVGHNNASTVYSGNIFGGSTTNLIKVGTGTLTMTGTNAFPGSTLVQDGSLLVNGALAGPVHVQVQSPGVQATLGGTGRVRNLTAVGTGARVSPGATTSVPSYGRLTATNIALASGAIYNCEIGGTNVGVNLDQIEARDTFTLTGGGADFTAFGAGAVSNRYAVVKSFAAVSGTFLGDPEGDTIYPAAGRVMQITYVTAGGQEITLIEQAGSVSAIQISSITLQPDGYIKLTGAGAIGATYFIEANADLATTNWVSLSSVPTDFNGHFSFTDTNAPSFPTRFYRFALP